MAKVKVNIDQAQKNLRERFKKASEDTSLLKDIGETVVKNAKGEARLGKEPSTGEKFKPFADNKRYPKQRKRIADRLGQGRNFKPKKSNLTITGQLIESIDFEIVDKKVNLRFDDSPRIPYGEGDAPTNDELGRYHREGLGNLPKRDLLGVSEKTEKTVANKIRAFFRRTVLKR